MNKTAVIVSGFVAGCGCLCICLCAALFVMYGAGLVFSRDTVEGSTLIEIEEIEVDLIVPAKVKIQDDFVVEMQIRNVSSSPQILDSIDIHEDYMHGAVVTSTEPAYTSYRTFMGGGLYHSYDFLREIPANSTSAVKFFMTAEKTGDYAGLVFVCVDSGTACNTYKIETVVED